MLYSFVGRLLGQRSHAPARRHRTARSRTSGYRPELLALESRIVPSTVRWMSPVNGDWDTAANWTDLTTGMHHVPGSSDDAVIPFRNIAVTHSTSTTSTVVSLVNEATLDIAAGSLQLRGGSGFGGGDKPSRTDGLISVSSGALAVGDGHGFFGIVLSGTGTVRNSATLNLNPDSTLDLRVDNEGGVFTDIGNIDNGATQPFVNGTNATLRVMGTTATFDRQLVIANGFTNQGRIEFVHDSTHDFPAVAVPNGTVVNAAGATMDFNGGTLSSNLDNQGSITVESGAGLGKASGTVSNEGTIHVEPDRFAIFADLAVTRSAFTNTGAITLSGRSDLGFSQSIAFTNSGQITLTDASQRVSISGGTFQQNGSLSGPGSLSFTGITATLTPDAIGGIAMLNISNSTITSPSPLTNLGSIRGSTINADVVNRATLAAVDDITINGAFTNASGGLLTVTGQLTLTRSFSNDGSIVLGTGGVEGGTPTPGILTVPQTLTNNGSIQLVNGDVAVSTGTLTNGPGGTITFGEDPTDDGSGTRTLHATLDNQGTLEVRQQGADITGSVSNSGTVDVQGRDLSVSPADPTSQNPTFVNTGTVTVRSEGAVIVTAGDFTNSGTVSVQDFGGVAVAGNYTQTAGSTQLTNGLLSAGGLVDLEGGTLTGTGVINANVRNNAEMDVARPGSKGLLTVAGDYTQGATGVLVIEIAGGNPGTDFDQLAITGQATLDGTLTVHLNGFVPNSGDQFAVLTFASGTGTFATINGDGPAFTPSYDPTDVTLVAN
jgi:hypothetical protein